MDVDEIFEKFGVETEKAVVMDRIYVPNCATIAELTEYSRKKKKALNLVKRHKFVYIINESVFGRREYSELNEANKLLIEEALERADMKNRGYWGQ